jgi:hypothetical protein
LYKTNRIPPRIGPDMGILLPTYVFLLKIRNVTGIKAKYILDRKARSAWRQDKKIAVILSNLMSPAPRDLQRYNGNKMTITKHA